MPADVDEGPQSHLLVAKDDDRYREPVTGDVGREVIADAPQLRLDADDLPRRPKDELVLELGDPGFGIEHCRQRRAVGENPVDQVGVERGLGTEPEISQSKIDHRCPLPRPCSRRFNSTVLLRRLVGRRPRTLWAGENDPSVEPDRTGSRDKERIYFNFGDLGVGGRHARDGRKRSRRRFERQARAAREARRTAKRRGAIGGGRRRRPR